MGRRREAPADTDCPYRHRCPHLEGMACSWLLENYQEAFELREQLDAMERQYQQRIKELETTLLQRDATIAQLRLQHRKQFKANLRKPAAEDAGKPARKRGAPVGHPAWRRPEPERIDRQVVVPAPSRCPHCDNTDLRPYPEAYAYVQQDIVMVPEPLTTQYVHGQAWCGKCRRPVYQNAPDELPGCQIGPVTRAVAIHLRYDLQIPYRKTQHILKDIFGMPLVPASAMAFDRKATVRGRPLYEELRIKLQSSPVVHADETSWREDGHGHFVWYGGHQDLSFFQITPDRSSESAVQLLGEEFGGTLIVDAYAAYNATEPLHWQTCWAHINRRAKELLEQIRLTEPAIDVPQSVRFLKQLRNFGSHLCDLGRQQRRHTLRPHQARALIPRLQKRLKRIARGTLDYPPAQTLRTRLMEKDYDKLLTFLEQKNVDPTNNHAERSIRPHVIMRKICGGTRSAAGSESHAVLPSLLQTAQRQGKSSVPFLLTLLTGTPEAARDALFRNGP